jgi:hypothetical protein
MGTASYTCIVMFVAGPMVTIVSHKNGSDLPLYYIRSLILFFTVAGLRIILGTITQLPLATLKPLLSQHLKIIARSSKNHFQMREMLY